MNWKSEEFLKNWEYGRQVSVCLEMFNVGTERLGSQNSPMEVSIAFLGRKLDIESEKVGGYIGLRRWATSVGNHPSPS